MSETAAFFAKKKKKKKAFKFNANLVDADTVTPTAHIDAPALSTETDGNPAATPVAAAADASAPDPVAAVTPSSPPTGGSEWDDEALAAATAARKASGPEVMDMKSMEKADNSNIAEKLRVEETRAQLAAARKGMEREAQKMREEKDAKPPTKKTVVASRFAHAAGGGGPRWGGAGGSRFGGGHQKLDTANEELFPDLASAGKILEQQEKSQAPAYKVIKKTPVGGGANWASKKPVTKAEAPAPAEKAPSPAEEQAPSPQKVEKSSVPTPARPLVKKTKKKKKDLSSFKVGGS